LMIRERIEAISTHTHTPACPEIGLEKESERENGLGELEKKKEKCKQKHV